MTVLTSPEGIEYIELGEEEKETFGELCPDIGVDWPNARLLVPEEREVEIGRRTTGEGYEIVDYGFEYKYPKIPESDDRYFALRPRNPEVARGCPCLACGSTETECWDLDAGDTGIRGPFRCLSCHATGEWNFYCRRRPLAIHLHNECDCAPDCGCEYDPVDGSLVGPGINAPSSDTTITVPMEHKPGCSAAGR